MDVLKKDGKGNLHRVTATMILNYDDENMAKSILKSIETDNYNFVKCRYERGKIICEAGSNKISSLIHTLDDLLSCILTAEGIYHSI